MMVNEIVNGMICRAGMERLKASWTRPHHHTNDMCAVSARSSLGWPGVWLGPYPALSAAST